MCNGLVTGVSHTRDVIRVMGTPGDGRVLVGGSCPNYSVKWKLMYLNCFIFVSQIPHELLFVDVVFCSYF